MRTELLLTIDMMTYCNYSHRVGSEKTVLYEVNAMACVNICIVSWWGSTGYENTQGEKQRTMMLD